MNITDKINKYLNEKKIDKDMMIKKIIDYHEKAGNSKKNEKWFDALYAEFDKMGFEEDCDIIEPLKKIPDAKLIKIYKGMK